MSRHPENYPPQGNVPHGYPPQGGPQGYPPQNYPPQGYPPQEYSQEYIPQNYPPSGNQGYPPGHQGYPPQGHQGYPPQGHQGYPPKGHQGYPDPQAYPPQDYPPQGFTPPNVHHGNYPPQEAPRYPQEGGYTQGEPYSQYPPGHPQNPSPYGAPAKHPGSYDAYGNYIPKPYRTQNQLVVHEAKAIMYSCMDFRLLDDICVFMNNNGLNNNYDQFILAGASLAFVQERFKPWRKIAKEHLDLAIQLHHIREIICIEHQQCGAYKMCYPNLAPENEKQQHVENVIIFERKMAKSHPGLKLHAFYMYIDGHTEKIN